MRRLFLLLGLMATTAAAQPSPEAFLGYPLGSRFTRHDRVVAYTEAVADAAPDRVKTERYGETPEGRPLVVAFVSSPENLARLEAIRRSNLAMAGLDNAPVLDDAPAIVWLSYNVHGNEAVSSEAAMEVLHRLVTDPDAQAWLARTVVVLDPCLNPDGRDRYTAWYNQTVGRFPDANPLAREHAEPWPGGRANHYLFDLNRDWAWGTQAESRARVALYRRWMPHVHADYHEQGVDAPYYFAPAAEPYHAAITAWQRHAQTHIGQANATTFDDAGRLYFTRQVFDLLYPSYGDTWPLFNGSVGMTYEQGGGPRAGLAIETAIGDTLTLAYRIQNHVATSLNNVRIAARDRDDLVAQFRRYFATASDGAPFAAYVVRRSNGPARLAGLRRVLDHNGLRYAVASARTSGDGFDYRAGHAGRVTAEPGDLVVPVDQPNGRLAQVLFEPEAALADSLTYDITAWALPYAHDLDAVALRTAVATRPFAPEVHSTTPATRAYAYAFPWGSTDDARLLAALLRNGLRVRSVATDGTFGTAALRAGALLVARADNARLGEGFDAAVRRLADSLGVAGTPLATGFAERGFDLGSDASPLSAPRVVVLSGPGVSSLGFGEVWHHLDETLGYPATVVSTDGFDAALPRADVVVFPDGRYGAFLTDARMTALRSWVRGGGTLVVLEGAAEALAGKDDFALKAREAAKDTTGGTVRYADRERAAVPGSLPGAVFRVRLDPTHPLAYGYGPETYALVTSSTAMKPFARGDGWNVGTILPGARVSGFVGAQVRTALDRSLLYGVEDLGRGHVVYLVNNPLFRGFWQGGHLLFDNALFRFTR
ncbi:MAG: M14 family metallopeptidase [Bacteroidetes bacterium]|nr:M14 family metallopeptidase [Bacteroidota bacterium]